MAAVDTTNMLRLVQGLMSAEAQERQAAEALFKQAKASEPDNIVLGMLAVVAQPTADEPSRRQAAILLRQLAMRGLDQASVFERCAPGVKLQVADELLRRFEEEQEVKIKSKIGDVVAALAERFFDAKDSSGWLGPQCGWPSLLPLVYRMAAPGANPHSCTATLRLLKDLTLALKGELVSPTGQQQLGGMLQGALASGEGGVRAAALLLVCEMVQELDKKEWAPLLATASVLTQVLRQLEQAGLSGELQECMQAFIDTAALEPDFFKQSLAQTGEPASFFASVAKAHGADEGLRNGALEFLVSFAEKKPKWLAKHVPTYVHLVLECCMTMMLEVDDSEQALTEWAARLEDEEGEEDLDELFHAGEQSVDRIAEEMGIEHVKGPLFTLIGQFMSQEEWQKKLAALSAMKQVVEYVEDPAHLEEIGQVFLRHVDHQHPRVRHTAVAGIGQAANDQKPHFQEASHGTVMPMLMRKMDDPVDRVAEMAMSAFVAFGGELDKTLMISYSHEFMLKLAGRLQTTHHRGIREESVTAIACIADAIGSDFSQYYDTTMPMLKHIVMHAVGEKENRLRGKAFECMSLLGGAVGKERFLPDAKDAITEMMKTPLQADDVQREYIKEASERICACLKRDFTIFLPVLLPSIFGTLRLEGEDDDGKVDDEVEYISVATGEGKFVKVKTSRFEEINQSVQLLHTFCEEMEGAYFDWIPQTAEALMPLLETSDNMAVLCEDARGTAFHVWALLIKCARAGIAERQLQNDLPQQLLRTMLPKALQAMEADKDPETLGDTASGIADCLKSMGEAAGVSGDETLQLIRRFFGFIDESFERSIKFEKVLQESAVGAPPELQDDEDNEGNTLDDEETCRRAYGEALGAIMKVAPAEFFKCLPDVGAKITQWLASKQNKVLALHMACDMLLHLKEQSVSLWPVFMPAVFSCLQGNQEADARIAAAYAVNLAAPLPGFEEAAPEAFRLLAKVVSGPTSRRGDIKELKEKARAAMDNAVSALFMLAKEKPSLCPAEIQVWSLIVGKLPLKEDVEEAHRVHGGVADLVLAQHAGLLGPERANLGKILSALAEVYCQENLSTKETDSKILRIFRLLPRDHLVTLAGSFTEKQQKRIEKMMSEGGEVA